MARGVTAGAGILLLALSTSHAQEQTSPAAPPSGLCNEDKTVCVAASVAHSMITNPLTLDVRLTAPDWELLNWKLTDDAGRVLGTSAEIEYFHDLRASQPTLVHIHNFILTRATSPTGTLTLTPRTLVADYVDLPGLAIPVRLGTATSVVTTIDPESGEAFNQALNRWMDGESVGDFDPKVRLVPHPITIMGIERGAIIEATAEAVLRKYPGQAVWHVEKWRREGTTVYVAVRGETWAGSSGYGQMVCYLITRSLLNLSGIKKVVFE